MKQLAYNTLSANVGYTPHVGEVTCSRCGPRTGKIIKNGLRDFESLLQNGILHFVFRFSQKLRWKVRI